MAGQEISGCVALLGAGWTRLREQVARMTGREDSEDLLHDAWLGLVERRVTAERPVAMLARAAANRGIDAHRRETRIGTTVPIEIVGDILVDAAPLQDEILIARHRLERLRGGVAKLPPRTREIFLLHRLEGRRYREIAEDLGISQSAVEKHIARAMTQLTDWMETW